MMGKGLDPAGLVTHVGGINAVIETTLNLPSIPGGKKLIYTHIEMPLTPIVEFRGSKAKSNPVYAELHKLCESHKGLWNHGSRGLPPGYTPINCKRSRNARCGNPS